MAKALRPYQQAAIDSLFAWFSSGNQGHPLIVAPVGSGKSLIIAEFIRKVHEMTPRVRIIIVSHVKELLVQNHGELIEQYPTADVGFYCAGLGQKKLHNDITIASVQSLWNKVTSLNRAPQIVIVDECHLISHNDDTTYRKFFAACLELNPDCKIIGATGTPFRASTGRLDEGEGALFDGVAYQIEMGWMVKEGFWSKPFTPQVNTRLSVEGVKVVGGDYVAKQLEEAVDVAEITKACVAEIVAHGADRKNWLIFTAGVLHCEHVRDAIRAHGIVAEMVTGETPKEERDAIIARHKAGEIRALVNVAVLTVGYNAPEIDMLVFMRPTRSPVLYIQCAGRGVRPVYAPGHDLSTREGRLEAIANSVKKDVMILDFGGVIETLGPLDSVDIRKKNKKGDIEAPLRAAIKICPSCGAECATAQKYCYMCSYSFVDNSGIEKKASNAAIMSADTPTETFTVWHVGYHLHTKKDDPEATPTMRVSYATNGGHFSEWVCFQHQGFARQNAEKWHMERLPLFPIPNTVEEAINLPYPKPDEISVRREGKYNRIVEHHFSDSMEPITPEGYQFKGAEEIVFDPEEVPF